MKRLKEKILEDNQLPTPSPTDRSTPSTLSSTRFASSFKGNSIPSTPPHTTRSNDAYVYRVGIVAVLSIGVCVFLHITHFSLKLKKRNNDCSTTQHEKKKRSATNTKSYVLDPI